MASKTDDLLATRPGKYVADYIDDVYIDYSFGLDLTGRLDELMEEAIDIENSIVRPVEMEFFKNNPLPHSDKIKREYNTLMLETKERVNHELRLLIDAEIEVWKTVKN
ncbi:MAG: hypothetical protein M9916_05985 [Crocinitomicaceae bacterium]|nr:hypothetical protein [Crocinitomicaceae bacterium]